jgi:nucleoside-diphosphate-sugar epimerase
VEGCDAVLHIAAVYKVGIPASECAAMMDANVGGTERVLDAAIAAGTPRIVYVSTVNVFGNTRGQVVDEDYRRDLSHGFLSCYDESKYKAHVAAEERIAAGAPIVVAQPGGVYGPNDHSEVGTIIDQARTGKLPFISFGGTGIVACYVDDIADGLVLVLDKGQIGRSYVLGGEVTTFRQIIERTARLAGRRAPRLSMPSWAIKSGIPMAPLMTRLMGLPPNLRELIRVSDGVTYWATDARARRELGYAPRDMTTGLTQLIAAAAAAN